MQQINIAGIQQIGIGVPDVKAAFRWYRQHFGMDVPVFEEAAEANLMLPYTGGQPHSRHAILAINMKGGGGFEIWQYTSRTPQPPDFAPAAGDTGIFCARIKSTDVTETYRFMNEKKARVLGAPMADPGGQTNFFLQDPWGNHFQVVPSSDWFPGKGYRNTATETTRIH